MQAVDSKLPTGQEIREQLERFWLQHSPKLYQQLQDSGTLAQALEREVRLIQESIRGRIQGGQSPLEAWSDTMRDHLVSFG